MFWITAGLERVAVRDFALFMRDFSLCATFGVHARLFAVRARLFAFMRDFSRSCATFRLRVRLSVLIHVLTLFTPFFSLFILYFRRLYTSRYYTYSTYNLICVAIP